MSVRSGILAVLSLGPAYGLQVHTELESRMQRPGGVNVGQIYSTLDRLQTQLLVVPHGLTDDALPLYALSDRGEEAVARWLYRTEPAPNWSDFIGHVLMVLSIPGAPARTLVAAYRAQWAGSESADAAADGLAALAQRADAAQRRAACEWLDEVDAALDRSPSLAFPLGDLRPRRGRRPREV